MDKLKLRALIVTLRRALLMAAKACEIFLEDTHAVDLPTNEIDNRDIIGI